MPAVNVRMRGAAGILVFFLLGAAGDRAAAAAGDLKPVTLELNKLEPAGKDCRLFFVTDNPSSQAWPSLKLDLIFFGGDGIIAQRLAIEFGPVAAAKKRVRTFDLVGTGCGAIGSVLLNDAIECRASQGPVGDCLQHLNVSSRAKTPFGK